MDSKQRKSLTELLIKLCAVQDTITHMNEKGNRGVAFQEWKNERDTLKKSIIDLVDEWVS